MLSCEICVIFKNTFFYRTPPVAGFYIKIPLEVPFFEYCKIFENSYSITAQKMKFSIKNFFSKCEQIFKKLWIYSSFLKNF